MFSELFLLLFLTERKQNAFLECKCESSALQINQGWTYHLQKINIIKGICVLAEMEDSHKIKTPRWSLQLLQITRHPQQKWILRSRSPS